MHHARMADSTRRAERMEAWQASGPSARAFAEGKGYTAGALYYWHRRTGTGLFFARVVRSKSRGASGGMASGDGWSARPRRRTRRQRWAPQPEDRRLPLSPRALLLERGEKPAKPKPTKKNDEKKPAGEKPPADDKDTIEI